MSSGMQGGSPSDRGVINWINGALRADHDYLRLHHETIQDN